MKIRLRTLIIAWIIIALSVLWLSVKSFASFDSRINKALSGGKVSTVSMPMWYLYQYRSTELMRKSPMCWTPWNAYVTLDKYVHIRCENDRYYLCFDGDIRKMLMPDAVYNRKFARAFKVSGTKRQQVRQIYNYCRRTKYKAHVKTARQVFTTRQGDCAGIASAFYVLCKAKHIPVRYVIGWVADGSHAWNRVMLNATWYWIDCSHGLWLNREQFKGRTVMEIW